MHARRVAAGVLHLQAKACQGTAAVKQQRSQLQKGRWTYLGALQNR